MTYNLSASQKTCESDKAWTLCLWKLVLSTDLMHTFFLTRWKSPWILTTKVNPNFFLADKTCLSPRVRYYQSLTPRSSLSIISNHGTLLPTILFHFAKQSLQFGLCLSGSTKYCDWLRQRLPPSALTHTFTKRSTVANQQLYMEFGRFSFLKFSFATIVNTNQFCDER